MAIQIETGHHSYHPKEHTQMKIIHECNSTQNRVSETD